MQYFATEERIEKGLRAIENDRRRGARELAARSLKLFRQARPAPGLTVARYRQGVRRLGRRLDRCRPAMAPIGGVAARVVHEFARAAGGAKDAGEAYSLLRHTVARLDAGMAQAVPAMARLLARDFPRLTRFMVISYSSQVIGVLQALRRMPASVTVCESRPACEGRRTAARLVGHARTVRLITEAQIALAMQGCDAVVLGCDAIHGDGSISNKTGSYLLALAAGDWGRPVIVLGDDYKLTPTAAKRPGETHPPSEVWTRPPRGVEVGNDYFEIVPARLIDYIIFEDGALAPDAMGEKAAAAAAYRNALARG